MSISLGPFITCFIVIAFLTAYLYIILYRSKKTYIYGTKIIFVGISIIFLRMCIPINFSFTHTIYSTKILPIITEPFYMDIGKSDYMIFDVFLLCWLSVAIILLIRLCMKKICLHNYLKEYTITESGDDSRLFSSVSKCYSDTISIVVIPHNISPSIAGIFHPTIIFPNTWKDFTEKELDYICMHEINHYKNHDLWLKFLVEIVSCIHWWNPLVYLMKREYALTLELVNDYQLLKSYSDFEDVGYAELVLKIAKGTTDSLQPNLKETIPFVRGTHSDLYTRIDFILKLFPKQTKKESLVKVHTVIICVAMIFSLLFVVESMTKPSSPVAEDGTFEMNPENTYFIQTPEGYELYIDEQFITIAKELPEEFKDFKIYKQGEKIDEH